MGPEEGTMFESPGRRWGFVFISLGVTLAAAGLTFWFAWGLPGTSSVNQAVLGIVVHVVFGYIVVMSGLTIYRSDLDTAECFSAAKWCAGGFGLMALFVLWASAPDLLAGQFTLEILNELVVVGSVGAAAGALIGLNRGQAVQNRRLVEEKEDQRDTLLFLLRLLRHDVRHDLVTIGGYADLLGDEVDRRAGDPHARLDDLLVGVDTGEGGEKRGVDVDGRGRGIEKRLGEHAHVAVETDQFGVVPRQSVEDALLVGLAALVVAPLDDFRGDTPALRFLQDGRVGVVREDNVELDVPELFVDMQEVPPAVARQPSEFHTR